MHIHNTRPFSETHQLMLAMEGADQERNRLLLVKHTHIHNTSKISKTHFLMLAMEGADKDKNRLLLDKRTQHKTIEQNSQSDVGNRGSRQLRKETGYLWSNIHTYTTQDHSVKLTA